MDTNDCKQKINRTSKFYERQNNKKKTSQSVDNFPQTLSVHWTVFSFSKKVTVSYSTFLEVALLDLHVKIVYEIKK